MTGWSREGVESGSLHRRRMIPAEWVAASEAQLKAQTETGRIGPIIRSTCAKAAPAP